MLTATVFSVRIDTRHQVMGRTGHPDIAREPDLRLRKMPQAREIPLTRRCSVAGSIRESIPLASVGIHTAPSPTPMLSSLSAMPVGMVAMTVLLVVLYTRYRGVPAIRYPDTDWNPTPKSECIRFVHSCCSLGLYFGSDALNNSGNLGSW